MNTLDWETVRTKVVHNIKTGISCSTVWKYIVIWTGHRCQNGASDFHPGYLRLQAHARKRWLRKWASILRCMYIAWLVKYGIDKVWRDPSVSGRSVAPLLYKRDKISVPIGDTKLLPTTYTIFTVRSFCFTFSRVVTSYT